MIYLSVDSHPSR